MSYGYILLRTSYYENGAVSSECIRDDESGDYNWKYYHPNGQIASIGLKLGWPQDAQDGEWIYYHKNGKLYKTALFSYGGLTDIINCFDGQGNPLNKGTFINGEGEVNEFDVNGKLIKTDTYKEGVLVKD